MVGAVAGQYALVALLSVGCASRASVPEPAETPGQREASAQAEASQLAALQAQLDAARRMSHANRAEEAVTVLTGAARRSESLGRAGAQVRAQLLAELAAALVMLGRTEEARARIAQARSPDAPGTLPADRLLYQLQITLGEAWRRDQRPELMEQPFVTARNAALRHPELWAELSDASLRLSGMLAPRSAGDAAAVLQPALKQLSRLSPSNPNAKLAYAQLHGACKELIARDEPARQGRRADLLAGIARAIDASGTLSDVAPSEAVGADAPPSCDAVSENGQVQNAAQVVADMRAGFRSCYQDALGTDPQAHGEVRVLIKIGESGVVMRAFAVTRWLPVKTLDCMLHRAAAARFDAPVGGSAVIAVPVTFVKN